MSREQANSLCRAGHLAHAQSMYTACLVAASNCSERAKLHNNMSVCCWYQNDVEGALRHARACLELDPTHWRCHLRLSILLFNTNDVNSTTKKKKKQEREWHRHFFVGAALLGQQSCHWQKLARSPQWITLAKNNIVLVSNSAELYTACQQHGIVVMLPGKYYLEEGLVLIKQGLHVWLIGLGIVVLVKTSSHAVCAHGSFVRINNIRIDLSAVQPTRAASDASASNASKQQSTACTALASVVKNRALRLLALVTSPCGAAATASPMEVCV